MTQPQQPRTAAGREVLKGLRHWMALPDQQPIETRNRIDALHRGILAIEAEAAALSVEEMAEAAAKVERDFWVETGNEDARDGYKEMVFDYDGWAAAILKALAERRSAQLEEQE